MLLLHSVQFLHSYLLGIQISLLLMKDSFLLRLRELGNEEEERNDKNETNKLLGIEREKKVGERERKEEEEKKL